MTFFEWITKRANTRNYEVCEITVRKMGKTLFGLPKYYDKLVLELRKPEFHDKKSLFVQVLRVKLNEAKCSLLYSWETFLGWLRTEKATPATLVLARSVYKQYERARRNLRNSNGYGVPA